MSTFIIIVLTFYLQSVASSIEIFTNVWTCDRQQVNYIWGRPGSLRDRKCSASEVSNSSCQTIFYIHFYFSISSFCNKTVVMCRFFPAFLFYFLFSYISDILPTLECYTINLCICFVTVAHLHCTERQFMCGTRRMCIPARWVCDGRRDCSDGSDEAEILCKS